MIIWLIMIGVSSVLYRMGGTSMGTKWRDFGCPVAFNVALIGLGLWSWPALIATVIMFGALTTYWDFLFGGVDNLYMHGFCVGLATAPLILTGTHWCAVGVYFGVLALVMGLMNTFFNKWKLPFRDYLEECGRGAVIIAALPLLRMFGG